MDIKEAYRVMQAQWVKDNDIRVGDTVMVVKDWKSNELGFSGGAWGGHRDEQVIEDIFPNCLLLFGTSCTPFFALEFISHTPVEEKMVDIDGKKFSLSTIKEALKAHIND